MLKIIDPKKYNIVGNLKTKRLKMFKNINYIHSSCFVCKISVKKKFGEYVKQILAK